MEGRDTLIVDVRQILDSEIDERSDPFARDHKYLTKSKQHAVGSPLVHSLKGRIIRAQGISGRSRRRHCGTNAEVSLAAMPRYCSAHV